MRSLRGVLSSVLLISITVPGLASAAGSPARLSNLSDELRSWPSPIDSATAVGIPLRFMRGVSVTSQPMGGYVTIDYATGAVSAQVYGIAESTELWLVDNQPGKGASTLIDRWDRTKLVGRLEPTDSRATLREVLGALGGFEVDRVVVCRAGTGPENGILITGSPSTAQRSATHRRVLSDTREEELAAVAARVKLGKQLFEEETFGGNGRTCATCHPATHNFTIDAGFIATLPPDDSLFIAEQVPELAELENPLLMRSHGLILENLDGFDKPGVMRGVPHTLALPTSVQGPNIPFDNTLNPAFGVTPPAERTGWGGDGAPGSGSLREFAIGAVMQHFPRTLARVVGKDFRLPTDEELDALETFQLSLGRQEDPDFENVEFTSAIVREGLTLFNRLDSEGGTLPAAKCGLCHSQASANIDSVFFTRVLGAPVSGNANFGTGVNELAALPGDLVDPERNPRDGGFARVPHLATNCQPPRDGFGTVTPPGGVLPPGLCEEDFNTPSLVEAADTAPFFHNNAVDTIEGAVAFYNNEAFNASAGGQILKQLDSGGVGIELDTSEVSAVAAFLRAANALENIRESNALATRAADERWRKTASEQLERALAEERDAIEVLSGAGLHPEAVGELRAAVESTNRARSSYFRYSRRHHLNHARDSLERARTSIAVERP